MDQEVNRATWIGVVMVVLVTLAAVVAFTLVQGRGMMNSMVDKFSIMLGLKGGTIQVLEDTVTPMSAASAQLLIAENTEYIDMDESKMKNFLYGDTTLTDLGNVTTRAHGDVILEVDRLTSGRFKVLVHRYNCAIKEIGGSCTCNPIH